MEHNHVRQPLIILTIITATLIALSFIPTQKLLPSFIKPIDIFSDLKKEVLPETNTASEKGTDNENTTTSIKSNNQLLIDYSLDAPNSFTHFLEKLENCSKDNTKVNIAYFGDSFIESDFITNDLRQLLQHKFGGHGVGFIPITSVSAGMRKSIQHSFSDNWNSFNIQQNSDEKIGLSGYAYTANEGATTMYTMPTKTDSMPTVQLLYGQCTQVTNLIITEDTINRTLQLPIASAPVNKVSLSTKNNHSISFKTNASNTLLYGCSIEDSTGVYIDNFSFRGSNGTQLMKLDTTVIQGFNQLHPYDLIVLHYGINVLGNNNTNMDWYKIGFAKTIQFIKNQFPNAAILIIGTSDKSTKTNGNYTTDKGVPTLLALQKELAQKNHTAFFNLYAAMGGENSMQQWVQEKPALAEKDYTHLTFLGAKKIATTLFQTITNF